MLATRLMRKVAGAAQMIKILKRQQHNDGLGCKLPGLTIANKTGSLDHLRNDVGIVDTKSGPVAVTVAITVAEIPGVDYGEDNPGAADDCGLGQADCRGLGPLEGRDRKGKLR